MEIFRMDVTRLYLSDLVELEPAVTMTDITLCWEIGPPIEYVFQILKRWRHLNRLSLMSSVTDRRSFPLLEVVLRDFIMGMEHLSYLYIVSHYDDKVLLEMLRDIVNKLILPRRPNFKFNISRSVHFQFENEFMKI